MNHYTVFNQMQDDSNRRKLSKKHVCQRKMYLSKYKMTPQEIKYL